MKVIHRRRAKRVLLLLIAVAILYVGARLLLLRPSLERDWILQHATPTRVSVDGDRVHVEGIRNFTYHTADDFEPSFYDRTFDLNTIESVWFVLSPFRDNWRGPAHGFISFGFVDSQYVSISVEARKEVGESYSVWRGALNKYELIYVVGDERDLIGLRAIHWKDQVYVYPLRASPQRMRELFLSMLQRAHELGETAEFYNTVLNNCTSNLYNHAKQLAPEDWSYSWKLQLPGYADEMLFDRGLVDTDLSLEEAREHFLVNEAAMAHRDDPRFSALIRQ